MGVSIDPTAPFKMYKVGFRAFKSPYVNACRVNSNTGIYQVRSSVSRFKSDRPCVKLRRGSHARVSFRIYSVLLA